MGKYDARILKETDTHFVIPNPQTGEPEEHPKVPGVMSRMIEGIRGQGSGEITNNYMQRLADIRKSKGWIK